MYLLRYFDPIDTSIPGAVLDVILARIHRFNSKLNGAMASDKNSALVFSVDCHYSDETQAVQIPGRVREIAMSSKFKAGELSLVKLAVQVVCFN